MHRGGRGDARASCASPLGTPLLLTVFIESLPPHWLFCIFPRFLLADFSSYFWDQVRIKLERIIRAEPSLYFQYIAHSYWLSGSLPLFYWPASLLSSFPIGCFCVCSAGSGADQNGAQYPGRCEPSFYII